jgi:lysyl-tRNA synthetase, class II
VIRARVSAPSLVGAAVAAAGAVGIASALTPSIASRAELVEGVLPPGVPRTARVLALALGLGLIWLSRALARGKRRGWQLAVVLVAASAAAHLAKGLDVEEAVFSLLVLAALGRYRNRFSAPGDPTATRPLLQAVVALGVVGALLALRISSRAGDVADLLEDGLTVVAGVLAVRAVYLWLRPLAQQVRQTPAERALAHRLVARFGVDSLSYFALRRDKSYFFSPSGRSFLAYRVVNGSALVSGDPIGAADELGELVAEFRRLAQSRGWRVAIVGASHARIGLYRSLGLRSVYLGDEAVVFPDRFSLDGRRIRKVRQSVARLERAGYDVDVVAGPQVTEAMQAELADVSREWRGAWPERGFGMAMDTLFEHEESLVVVATRSDEVGGFLQLVPAPASGGWSLSAMRRRPGTPNGLMEFLLVRVIELAREHGVPELSLNFAVFGAILRCDGAAPLVRRALRRVLVALDRLFQLGRLLSFSEKFAPVWRRRYICLERLSDFPLVGLAYLQAESLLTPPGPWARPRDLANH